MVKKTLRSSQDSNLGPLNSSLVSSNLRLNLSICRPYSALVSTEVLRAASKLGISRHPACAVGTPQGPGWLKPFLLLEKSHTKCICWPKANCEMGEIQPEIQIGEYSCFPLEGVTGTSSYRFDYNFIASKFHHTVKASMQRRSRSGSWDDICVVTEVSTLLIIAQVSSGFRNHIIIHRSMKYNCWER